ncbi:MAG: PLP-dependent aminotransferase family protein [Actinomycetota bacterium]
MQRFIPFDQPPTDRTANGIALAIGRLISTGTLTVGERMPTVRAVATQLDVSPTTVSEAWRILQRHGAIATQGRRGTFVRGQRQAAAPGRYWQVPVEPGTFAIDLSTGVPDPALLPPVGPILGRLELNTPVTSYLDPPVLDELDTTLRNDWPFTPELLTVVDGAQDALHRVVDATVNLGDTVIVDEPAYPPLLDSLEQAGAQVIGIPLDDEGVNVDALDDALDFDPVALFIQPRSHNPTGVTMSAERAAAVADSIADRSIIVVEDDHSGAVSTAPLNSIGAHHPDKVVHIRSFSKSHGPDLRLAAVAGAASPIDTLVRRRRLGPIWSSRLLQRLLFEMLRDDETQAIVAAAKDEYQRRRSVMVDGLGAGSVTVGGSSGINMWVPVVDEQLALVTLAAKGIGAAPGGPFVVEGNGTPHIRVSVGTVADGLEELAGELAAAATAEPSRSGAP